MKNKTFFLLLLFLAPALMCYAQEYEYEYVPFPTSGVIWSEAYRPPYDEGCGLIYERFALSGEDTLMNGHTYKKLYLFYDTEFDHRTATPIGGIREDEQRRVYYKGEKIHDFKPLNEFVDYEEIMLFDFSVSIGDTIKEGNIMSWDEGFWLVVQDIDTVMVGNTLRKRYSFANSFGKWIEGFGSNRGLLFTSGDTPTNGLFNYLICFKQDGKILYFDDDFSECMPPIVGVESQEWDWHSLRIFPNPVTGNTLTFDLGEAPIEQITIYNAKGVVKEYILVNHFDESYTYQHKLPAGYYIVIAVDKNSRRYSGKFVVY